MPPPGGPFQLLIKPIGAACNLSCQYCFYREKLDTLPAEGAPRMSAAMLEEMIRQYLAASDAPEVTFAWQGGESTLLGVEFFRQAVECQRKYANGRRILNTLQTNGTLLDDAWGEFLAHHRFLVGLSLDGPAALHDAHRQDPQGRPTFDAVMRGLGVLKKHGVEFNTLTVVSRRNSRQPLGVYQFLKAVGSRFCQFIPLVERQAGPEAQAAGLALAMPPGPARANSATPVTDWSVEPCQYGEFLVAIFDEWVRQDVGRVFVQLFDVALSNWMGLGSSLCLFGETCGRGPVLEHNGDVFACDHYVYPSYRLGNIMNRPLGELVQVPDQRRFGLHKSESLPVCCRRCDVLFACRGECPKHRFQKSPGGQPGLNYLCRAYQRFFRHIDTHMKTMSQLLRAGHPAARIMGRRGF